MVPKTAVIGQSKVAGTKIAVFHIRFAPPG
jgi:hypothetical protein